ncbi:MAG: methylenetetrahydrofolate reductase C-terminal domain-containing protein [Deltaproteobacteria bacterium]|nr:methylenetetrahydrofolate reductase C-terminal domain-containing protein [Deltaproteobacteria bacterium]
MIVAEQKPLAEILGSIDGAKNVLVLGCGTCVTVCFAGGTKEAEVLASSLRLKAKLEGKELEASHFTVQRQCEWEYLDQAGDPIRAADTVVSLACGVGAQAVVERFPEARMLPGLNTRFYGLPTSHGLWEERCAGCGDCVLDFTDGICPIARCSKNLLNGPCGGSHDGKCEVNDSIECAWQLIYDRMKKFGHLDRLLETRAPKDWRPARDGGPRKVEREDLKLSHREAEGEASAPA